jgi:iron complex outermembrane receptor protein
MPLMRHTARRAAAASLGFALLTGRALAQTITGAVTSAGRPVSGATVQLLELERADRTGADGAFRFANVPVGTFRIVATAFGYAPATDTVHVTGAGATVRLELRSSPLPLPPIVVTAAPTARPADEVYQPAASKGRIALDAGAGMTFAEKIADVLGVAVRGNGSAPARPILRGLGDNEVLVLENGLRTGDLATYDPAHATPIDALSIDQIDVVRGPATVLYGPSTIGGIVNVLTNLVPAVDDRGISGTVSAEGNSVNDEIAGYANTVFSSGQTAFSVSAGGVHANDTRIPAGSYTDPASGAAFNLDRLPQTFDHSYQGGLGVSHQGAFGMIGFGANRYQINYGIPGVPPNANWLTVPPTTSRIAQRRTTLELRSLFNAAGSLIQRVKVDASYNDYNHSEFPTAQDSTGVSDPQANHFHKQELNAVLQFEQRPHGRLSGTVGLWTDVQRLAIDGDQPLGPNSETAGVAAYAYEEYLAGSGTRLQGGIRYDYNRIHTNPNPQSTDSVFRTLKDARLSTAITASVGAIQQIGRGLTGSFSIARSFRAPTVQELFANGVDAASGTYSIGTATLGPEQGIGVDASLKGRFGGAVFEVSPFLNVIDHYIYGFLRGDTIQNFPVRQFGATKARLVGIEGSITVVPASHFVLLGNASYVNAQDTRQNVPLPFIPPLHGLLRATWQDQTYGGMAEVRMAARQTRLGDGDTPTPGYAVFDLGINVRLLHQGMTSVIALHCDNVFDQVYRDATSVIKDFVPQPGRALRLNYQLFY